MNNRYTQDVSNAAPPTGYTVVKNGFRDYTVLAPDNTVVGQATSYVYAVNRCYRHQDGQTL